MRIPPGLVPSAPPAQAVTTDLDDLLVALHESVRLDDLGRA